MRRLVFVALGNDAVLSFTICAVIGVVITACAGPAGRDATVVASASATPFRLNLPILIFGAVAISVEACLTGLGPTALINAGLSETAGRPTIVRRSSLPSSPPVSS